MIAEIFDPLSKIGILLLLAVSMICYLSFMLQAAFSSGKQVWISFGAASFWLVILVAVVYFLK